MECPNCSFQNAPGSPCCARCRTSLQLAGVDIIPPRAARTIGSRVRQRAARSQRRVGDRARQFARGFRRPWMDDVSLASIAWSIVPGMGHIRGNHAVVGSVLLGMWIALLLVAAGTLGRPVSWMLAFGAISVHSLAITLLLTPVLQRLPAMRRMFLGFALYGVLFLGIYLPLLRISTRCMRVLPVSGIREGLSIQNGDTLLRTSTWTRPEKFGRGDLVAFEIAPVNGSGVVVRGGIGVDRIVGTPGDHVVFADGILTINGRPCDAEHATLGKLDDVPTLDVTLGEEEYLILPTSLQWYRHGTPLQAAVDDVARQVARVPEFRVLGRVFWRANPLGRMGRP